ncbi:pilus assembly protein TadG-related protein [uncultured Mobiluncus sp.]|uniref:pilus assembly protein TadG-related protein n=1 Tax=uncultured Mobiluncus sp. TaxID=293425 RepID=UPI0025EE623D|nr:pilus assembly protein TadG-related protein [uncultured Mobiluncus sp.]
MGLRGGHKGGASPRRFVARFDRLGDEDGRIMLLGLAACVLLCVIILMSMAVSGVYLEQRRLQRLADQTASMAAANMADTAYYQDGIMDGVPLQIEPYHASERAAEYLSGAAIGANSGLLGIDLVDVDVASTRVQVTLRATGKIPLVLPLISSLTQVELTATGAASLKSSFG